MIPQKKNAYQFPDCEPESTIRNRVEQGKIDSLGSTNQQIHPPLDEESLYEPKTKNKIKISEGNCDLDQQALQYYNPLPYTQFLEYDFTKFLDSKIETYPREDKEDECFGFVNNVYNQY